jgi:heme exporter protein C
MNMKQKVLGIASLVAIPVVLYFALVYAPTEATMGTLQRVLYFHVPQAVSSYAAAFLFGLGAVMYLITRDLKWDRFAYCSAELGVLFATTTLATGIIWGRLAWNVWWAGDARTNLELILNLSFIGYIMLRSYLPEREKRARLSTVFAILAVINVPINYGAIYWWNTQHPKPVFGPAGGGSDPAISTAMLVSLICFGVVFAYLLTRRLAVARIEDEVGELEALVETA